MRLPTRRRVAFAIVISVIVSVVSTIGFTLARHSGALAESAAESRARRRLECGCIQIVVAGQTLSLIADMYQVPWEPLCACNQLVSCDFIMVGQQLKVSTPLPP
jgi:hypothetical protein